MLWSGFKYLTTAASAIEHQIETLKHVNLPFVVKLLEMAKLELMLHISDVSIIELDNFCDSIRASKVIE